MHQRKTSEWTRHVPGRTRLLIEDPHAVWFGDFERFRASGIEVAVCTGPEADGTGCPHITDEGRCTLVDEADVILCALEPSAVRTRILETMHERRPEIPVLVEVPREQVGMTELPTGCTALPFPASVEGQIRAVRDALSRTPAR